MDFDASDFPFVEWVKVNGKDFKDFIASEVDGQRLPVNAEVEVKFAGEDHKLHLRLNPKYLEDGVGFCLTVYGIDYPLTEIVYWSAGGNDTGVSSASSGGCEAGFGVMAGILALGFAAVIRRR